jgi:predicted Rossmann fold flavoprotein
VDDAAGSFTRADPGRARPLYLDPTPPAEWSGVALRDVVLKARRAGPDENTPGKEIMRWRGDLLWTHKGVSGPTALGVSREVAEAIPEASRVEVDIVPDEAFEVLSGPRSRTLPRVPTAGRERLRGNRGAGRLAAPIFAAAAVDGQIKGAYLGQKERNRLVATLKGWPLGRVRHVPLERGEVVAGGVELSEVDSGTMRSRKVPGLYLCGEVLDIAGPVGGYNLQAAWSTGFVAGDTAAADLSPAAARVQ